MPYKDYDANIQSFLKKLSRSVSVFGGGVAGPDGNPLYITEPTERCPRWPAGATNVQTVPEAFAKCATNHGPKNALMFKVHGLPPSRTLSLLGASLATARSNPLSLDRYRDGWGSRGDWVSGPATHSGPLPRDGEFVPWIWNAIHIQGTRLAR